MGGTWGDVPGATYHISEGGNEKELQPVIQAIVDSIDRGSNYLTSKTMQLHSSVTVNLEQDSNGIRGYLTPIPNSLAEFRTDLVAEWNTEKNGNLRPRCSTPTRKTRPGGNAPNVATNGRRP